MTLEAVFDENYVLTEWQVVPETTVKTELSFEDLADTPVLSSNIPLNIAEAALEKTHGVSGPFSDVMFDPFVVVYGTRGTDAQNADSLRAAQNLPWSGTTG